MTNSRGEEFLKKYDPFLVKIGTSTEWNKSFISHATMKEVRAGNGLPHGGVYYSRGDVPWEKHRGFCLLGVSKVEVQGHGPFGMGPEAQRERTGGSRLGRGILRRRHQGQRAIRNQSAGALCGRRMHAWAPSAPTGYSRPLPRCSSRGGCRRKSPEHMPARRKPSIRGEDRLARFAGKSRSALAPAERA